MVPMIAVISSSVAAVGYDPTTTELYVRFHHASRTYVYTGVQQSLYEQFLQASSKGRFLAWPIKGHYPYRHVA
jgi:KTSC domain